MPIKNKESGFTLVELIVVLVILGILAAILVPTMLGWIRDAKEEQVLLYANTAFKAAQSSLIESYGLDPEFNDGANRSVMDYWDGAGGRTYLCGHVTNATFSKLQKDSNAVIVTSNNKKGTETQRRLANKVLNYLGASNNNKDKFDFDSNKVESQIYSNAKVKEGTKVNAVVGKNTGLIIAWDQEANIIYFSFVYNQCMVMYCPHLGVNDLQIIDSNADIEKVTGGDSDHRGKNKRVSYGIYDAENNYD